MGKIENKNEIKNNAENNYLIEEKEMEQMKNKIIKNMEIEENIGNNINILEYKK